MSVLALSQMDSTLVPSPRGYRTLVPEGHLENLPLLLLLHGGGDSSEYLEQIQPLFDQLWDSGELPPIAVATLDAERSFYLDWQDGSQRWETFVLTEWLNQLRATLPVGNTPEMTLIAGISMGGHGATRIGLRYPERFLAMAAMEPAVMPVLDFADLPAENIAVQPPAVLQERYGTPPNAYWNDNNPNQIVMDNAESIKTSGISIYLEAGTDDFFLLNEGTEFLHQILLQNGIQHEYRLVLGGNHIGNTLPPRFLNMLDFLARILNGPTDDPALAQVRASLI